MGPKKNSGKRKSGKAKSSKETTSVGNFRGSGKPTIEPNIPILDFVVHTTKVKLAYSTEDEGKKRGWGTDECGHPVYFDNIGQCDIEKIKKLREDYQKLLESDNSADDFSDISEDSDDDGTASEATSIPVTHEKVKVSTLEPEPKDKGEVGKVKTKKIKKRGHPDNDPDVEVNPVASASPPTKSQEIWEAEQISKHNIRKHCKIPLVRCEANPKFLPPAQTIRESNESESQKESKTKNLAYKCEQCGKGFKHKSSLQDHSYTHTGETPYKCDLCPKKYGHYPNLYTHMKREHDVRLTSKQFQEQKMVSVKAIKRRDPDKSNDSLESGCNAEHISSDTEEKIKLTMKTNLPSAKPRQFPCLKRRKRFKRMHHLHDNEQRERQNVSSKRLKQSDSGKSIASKTNYESDDDLFEPIVSKVSPKKDMLPSKSITVTSKQYDKRKPYPCVKCGKRFSLKKYLKCHNYIHTGERPFKCNTCPASFRQKGHLAGHTSTHTNERPFKCKTCPASFKWKSNLANHTLTHTNERPFKCKTCPASFKQKSGLANHTSTHTNGRPFKCNSCGASFKLKSCLTRHMRIHEKPFKCRTCSSSFNSKQALTNHIKRWHLGKPVLKKSKVPMATQMENGKRKRTCKKSGASNNHHLSKHRVQGKRQTPSPELFQIVEFPECKIILTRCTDTIHLSQIDSNNAAVNNQKSRPVSSRDSGGSTYVEFEGINLLEEEVSHFDVLTDKGNQEDESNKTDGYLPDQPNTDLNSFASPDVLNVFTDLFEKTKDGELPMDSDSETLVAQSIHPNILFEESEVTEAFTDLQNNVDQISTQNDSENKLEKISEQNLNPISENDCADNDVSPVVDDSHNAPSINPEMNDLIASGKVSETEEKGIQVASKDLALDLSHSDIPVSTAGIKEVIDSLLNSACEIDRARNEREKKLHKNSNLSSKAPANMAAMESVFEAVIKRAAQRENESVIMESNTKIEGSSPPLPSGESETPTVVSYPEVNKESNLPNIQLSVTESSCEPDLNQGKLPSPTPTETTIVSDELDTDDINLDLDLSDLLRKKSVPEHDGQCDTKAIEKTASEHDGQSDTKANEKTASEHDGQSDTKANEKTASEHDGQSDTKANEKTASEHDGQCDTKANEETASGNETVTDETSNDGSQKDVENKNSKKSDSVNVNKSLKTKKVIKRKRKHEALQVIDVGHKCLYCPRKFRERWRLVQHTISFHKAETLVSCTLCDKLFSKTYLEKHLNTVHNWTMPTQE